ncbi:hypothetical protein [Rhodococcus sp. BS-15]|uniref:hypothetical protein n=1 Tax=Rhodococcus sp. BS-15 TaxID=1304954 RepID=UPI001F2DBD63|nr:hypothetical protein [Rhodococcus sp. BS-15]
MSEVRYQLERGLVPDVVFIDFALDRGGIAGLKGSTASETGSGLGVLIALHRRFGPDAMPRIIVTTMIHEQGRYLYAIAATRWFHADAIVDKANLRSTDIREILSGSDPTEAWLRENIEENGHLLDELFAVPEWSPIWQVWMASSGRVELAYALLNGKVSKNRIMTFMKEMPPRVDNLRAAFFLHQKWGEMDLAQVANKAAGNEPVLRSIKSLLGKRSENEQREKNQRPDYRPLLGLTIAHSAFFQAPELVEAAALAEPWSRASSRRAT